MNEKSKVDASARVLRPENEHRPRLEHFEGSLIGLMVGDALGLPRERLSRQRARRLFGDKITHAFLGGRGMISDDTEHASLTAQAVMSLPSGNGSDAFARCLAWKLRWWLLGLPAGIGSATLRSILKLWIGFPPNASGVWSAGNGPAMRSPILGLLFAQNEPALRAFVKASTRLTHKDLRAETGAMIAAAAARYGATHPPELFSVEELLRVLLGEIPANDEEARRWLGIVREAVLGKWNADRFCQAAGFPSGPSGYMYQTIPAVLWAWLIDPFDFRGGMERIIRLGGDADTTAAIFGALCGGAAGVSAIPQEWIQGIWDFPRDVRWVRHLAGHCYEWVGGAGAPKPLPLFWPLVPIRNLIFDAAVVLHVLRRLLPPY